jgi:4-amino-4-deoxy-L-arabinose transferase-like glycosyltransferase
VTPPSKSPSRRIAIRTYLIAALLFLFAVLARCASLGKCATFDEGVGLVAAWIQTYDFDFRCNPEDPPLVKLIAIAGANPGDFPIDRQSPLWNAMPCKNTAQFEYAFKSLYRRPGINPDNLLNSARLHMLVFGVALGALIAWWAWRLAGPRAAIVSVVFFSLDPNFLAHAPLLKDDVPITFALLAVMACVWLVGERATLPRCLALALTLGIALATKFSGLLAIPMIAIALCLLAFQPRPWRVLHWTASRRSQRIASIAALSTILLITAYLEIWASYGFRFSMSGNTDQPFNRDALAQIASNPELSAAHPDAQNATPAQIAQWRAAWRPTLIPRFTLWAFDHHLLPEAWLNGFLNTYASSLSRASFLCGNFSKTGWWYYFPLAILFKTPLATLTAILLAAISCLWPRATSSGQSPDRWPLYATLVAPILYLIVAMKGNIDIGLRHVLPIYPFLFIFVGVMAARAWSRWPRIARPTIFILALGLATETLAAYPNYIAFFNAAVGGPRGGLNLLADSNLSWGQDLPLLGQWQAQHPDNPIFLIYSGTADPAHYGIGSYQMIFEKTEPDPRMSLSPSPVLAIDAMKLQATFQSDPANPAPLQLKDMRPIAVLGGTIYLFPIDADKIKLLSRLNGP